MYLWAECCVLVDDDDDDAAAALDSALRCTWPVKSDVLALETRAKPAVVLQSAAIDVCDVGCQRMAQFQNFSFQQGW